MCAKRRLSRQTWQFSEEIRVLGTGVVAGPMESEGPLVKEFDTLHQDAYAGEKTWEQAERKMMEQAIETALLKSGRTNEEMDVLLLGDLLNQMITSNYTARTKQIPFLGQFSACSTSMQGLALGSVLIDGGFAHYALTGCSSHNSTAERQYRYPTEYGGQKPPSAQWTTTGAGAAVVGLGSKGPRVTHATIGKVIDMGIKDAFDLGTAMAPAAADTLYTHFEDTGRTPADYDLIVTGDLGRVGAAILPDLMKDTGYPLTTNYQDCGVMLFHPEQEVFSGGSGCAASAIVSYGHIVNELNKKNCKRVLIVATGALFSPVSFQQGESIPCIAHAVVLEGGKKA